MTTTVQVKATHPPYVGLVDGAKSGTVTKVVSNGPVSFSLLDGSPTGAVLYTINVNNPVNAPASVAFTKGLYIKLNTPSDVTLTIS